MTRPFGGRPTCLAVALVLTGTYRAGGGALWPKVQEDFGIRGEIPSSEWGRFFERFLGPRGLTLFPRASQGGHRYLDLIFLHGGIPAVDLPGYFDHVLEEMVTRWAGWPAEDRLMAWLQEGLGRRDSPRFVLHYLTVAGEAASDFVKRTLVLYARVSEGAALESHDDRAALAASTGLSPRIVRAFAKWWAPEHAPTSAAVARKRHWIRPSVRFDAVRGAVVAELPAQIAQPAEMGAWFWRGEGQQSLRVSTTPWPSAGTWYADAMSIDVPAPARRYEAGYEAGGAASRWIFEGVDEAGPLLAFAGRDGALLNTEDGLPNTVLWIVRPRTRAVEAPGARLLEEGAALPPGWADFVAECWDLSGVAPGPGAFRLVETGEPDASLWVLPQGDLRPHHADIDPLPGVFANGAPVFSGAPSLVLPLRRGETEEGARARWHLTLRSEQDDVCVRTSLLDLPGDAVEPRPGMLAVRLGHEALTGGRIGRYEVHMAGVSRTSCHAGLCPRPLAARVRYRPAAPAWRRCFGKCVNASGASPY